MLVFYTLIPSLSGMPKQYFFPIGFMVPTAVFSSLIIAYSVAPWTAKRILKVPDHKEEPSPDGRPKLGKLGHFYYRTAGWLVGNPKRTKIFLAALTLLLILSFLMPAWQFIRPQGISGPVSLFGVETGFLPKDDKNTFNVSLKLAGRHAA